MINVTKTFFPPIEEYKIYLERVWKNQWLTNRGELVLELEAKLKDFLNTNSILIKCWFSVYYNKMSYHAKVTFCDDV
jgi:dTDP-4-amino-4,6-dideoxygalactose transaminase